MTATQTTPAVDEARVEAFVDRFLTDTAGAATTVMTVIGDRLGLYDAMAGRGPVTSADLAAATGLDERMVTEWLASQTVSGYVLYDPDAVTYELPVEHAMVLAAPDSPAHIVAVSEIVAAQHTLLPELERAFREGGGISWDAFPSRLFHAVQRYFQTAYRHELTQSWLPAVDGLVERLERGARVLDIGCGLGVATLLMARRWPASTFVGVDLHEPSIIAARAAAVEAGEPPNVSFHVGVAETLAGEPVDVVLMLDALHDMGDPPAALRRAREVLADDGTIIVIEPWSVDRLEDGIGHPGVRIDYSCSTSLCTPGSLSQPGAYGLGTQGGPSVRLRLLEEAGFRAPRLVADTGFNLVFAASR